MKKTRNAGLTWLVGGALAVCVGILVSAAFVDRAAAHGGGQDRYGGHTNKETGVYHCHGKEGTAKRDRCDMRVKVNELTAALKAAASEKAGLLQQIGQKDIALSVKSRELREALLYNSDLEQKIQTDRYTVRNAEDAAAEAKASAETARRDMREAEARARGSGPAVSSRCKEGVHAALDSGWTFSRAEKADLRRACLD